jgi:2-polyprenyl-3-methyl-5-hydroxy-6-metoxy-1,4-benzoquinol methylase
MEKMACPFCNGKLYDIWNNQTFSRCTDCHLLIRNKSLAPNQLDKLYASSWENPTNSTSETGGTTLDLANQYANFLLRSLDLDSFKGLKLLDYGAGRGDVAVALRQSGAEVFTLEPYGYKNLESMNFLVFRKLSDIPSDLVFDGIVSLDVVEHLPSPWNDIIELKKYLKSDGWIFISTPNSASLNAKLKGPNWREAKRKGHLLLFNSYFIKKMLKELEFRHIKQLSWNVHYTNNPIIRLKDSLLLNLKLDGELRFIAFK